LKWTEKIETEIQGISKSNLTTVHVDTGRDLTEFYDLKAKQDECDHMRMIHYSNPLFQNMQIVGIRDFEEQELYETAFCPDCGAYLTKGVNHG